MKELTRGEETMLILSELAWSRRERAAYWSDCFTWSEAVNAYDAAVPLGYPRVSGWRNNKRRLHMTVGRLLRGQAKGGTICKVGPGLYKFYNSSRILGWRCATPLYARNF